jgi:hypothetical protein
MEESAGTAPPGCRDAAGGTRRNIADRNRQPCAYDVVLTQIIEHAAPPLSGYQAVYLE